jgi:hypothetical protein
MLFKWNDFTEISWFLSFFAIFVSDCKDNNSSSTSKSLKKKKIQKKKFTKVCHDEKIQKNAKKKASHIKVKVFPMFTFLTW